MSPDEEEERRRDLAAYLDDVEEIADFQAHNGLVARSELNRILAGVKRAREKLESDDLASAQVMARRARFTLNEILGDKPLSVRLAYLYGLHIWVYLTAFLLALLAAIFLGVFNRPLPLFQDISGDFILWGGVGASAYAIYLVRRNIYQQRLSKYYAVYYFVYPFAGMAFGLGVVIAVAAGLISLQAMPSYVFYASVAFLAGMFQQWALKTLRDVTNAIHPLGD